MNVPIAQIKERSYKVAEEPEIAIINFDKNEWVLMSVNFTNIQFWRTEMEIMDVL